MASPRRRKTEARRLLIMACSSRKSPAFGLLPAIERYDGVAFRVVKRLLRIVQFPPDVDVMILSAKYGLIGQDEPIGDYDLRMTPELALEQAEHNCATLSQRLGGRQYREVFISASEVYLLALEPIAAWRRGVRVVTNRGRIGCQLNSLKAWLLQV